jgi:hypothetical protein
MDKRAFGDTVLNVCSKCKGLWVDWFDGNLVHIARDIAPLSIGSVPTSVRTAGNCPICAAPLVVESTTGAGNAGMYLWRCGHCVGTFVPRSSFETLAGIEEAYESTHDLDHGASSPPSPGSRLAATLRALLSG